MGAFLKDRKHDNFDWLEDPEYLDYRERYIQYIKEHEHVLEVYTNLDIINNPAATWENQRYFESRGLNPLPVWHFGSDISWLQRYIAKGYDYIGIGGLVPNPYDTIRPALDEIFTSLICDGKGMPRIKTHGFAATSIRLMCRYPWYSVDSASWIKYAAFGGIMIPQKIKGEYRYTVNPHKINISGKSPLKKAKDLHVSTLGNVLLAHVLDYIEFAGFKLGKSEFENVDGKLKEIIVEPGLCNRPELRSFLNAKYYMGLRDQLPEWPWAFKCKGLTLFNGE